MSRMNWERVHSEDRIAQINRTTTPIERKRRGRKDGRPKGFKAEYKGTCCLCSERIEPGDQITMWSRPKVAHVRCVPLEKDK